MIMCVSTHIFCKLQMQKWVKMGIGLLDGLGIMYDNLSYAIQKLIYKPAAHYLNSWATQYI